MGILGDETYDTQSERYAKFASQSFSWRYIERPGMDEYLADYYERGQEVRVLDIGCGSGRAIEHLIDRGIAAEGITGLDPSRSMLDIAALALPQEVSLVVDKAADMPFNEASFDLVVATMVLHAMDDREVDATIDRISDVLMPGGEFFFIDTNPRPDSAQHPIKQWVARKSPWGTTLNVFNHDVNELLRTIAPSHGLECVSSGPLGIDEAGRAEDPAEYARYAAGQFRLAALLKKKEE